MTDIPPPDLIWDLDPDDDAARCVSCGHVELAHSRAMRTCSADTVFIADACPCQAYRAPDD